MCFVHILIVKSSKGGKKVYHCVFYLFIYFDASIQLEQKAKAWPNPMKMSTAM